MKLIFKILKFVLCFLGVLVLIVGGYIGYVLLQYYRIDDNQELKVENYVSEKVQLNQEYSISTYNIGFGAYNQDYTFFMDTGIMSDGTIVSGEHATAVSKDVVLEDTIGAINTIKSFNPDFALFQEVDTDSGRSYNVNQYQMIKDELNTYTSTFAVNFHSAYLLYPFNDPIGQIDSGIATMSKYSIESSTRKSFTITDDMINKLFDLDRCFSASYLPIKDSNKYLVLMNIHMSAYDEGGVIRAKQMQELNDFMLSEYNKGNYIVAGGDFNHDLLTNNPDFEYSIANMPFKNSYTQLTPPWLSFLFDNNHKSPINDKFSVIAADNSPTCRDADIKWQPGTTYVSVIDGFIVSDNVEVTHKANLQTFTNKAMGFAYSDHEPATMKFILK